LLTGSDKQKLDELEVYELATDTIDGLLRAVDQIKLNLISINQPVDIDQLYQDVEDLKNGNGD
ncbi:hypothetical protein, partial [Pseudomonas sp. 2822-15]|uniref:hypothetical protein n=1 Tax=Pseudomonas sp. 2822-15 TaxID=1712677 RepID=UPI0013046D14